MRAGRIVSTLVGANGWNRLDKWGRIVFYPVMAQAGFPLRSRPTIRDVARSANVGISTVSSFLNSTRPVSTATRSRITRAIEDLGYEPN